MKVGVRSIEKVQRTE